jgi:CheY-like chemotaxis protein
VLCDPGQVEQVIMNLAVNARDAMPRGGTLTFETENVLVEPEAAEPDHRLGDWVRLSVRDTGTGMTPDVLTHLFEPFFTTKEQGKGTGLGLATIHGIVSQAGGYIRVASEPGSGSTFEVYLSRTLSSVAPTAGGPAATASLRCTETILVVEDDPQVRGITGRALARAGYRVLTAANGAEALGIAMQRAGDVDLVVTDVVMPGLSGPELARELRKVQPNVCVLYVSGYAGDALSPLGVEDPSVDLLSKPFTPASLLARVREILDRPGAWRRTRYDSKRPRSRGGKIT